MSESSVIINCDYCGARIMLPRHHEEPPKAAVPPPSFTEPDVSTVQPMVVAGIAALVFIIPIFIAIGVSLNNSAQSTPAKVYSAPAMPYTYPTPSSQCLDRGAGETRSGRQLSTADIVGRTERPGALPSRRSTLLRSLT